MKPAKQDGRPYVGNQQFAGNGVKRSCDKCGKHVPTAQLRRHPKLRLMCCEGCRA